MDYWSNILFGLVISLAMVRFCNAQNAPQDYVDAHNTVRAKKGLPNLSWDARVESYAQNYANQRKGDCRLVHSKNGPYGENIAWGSGFEMTGLDAVKMWVAEEADYDYNTNRCRPGKMCGHYTQVVWKNTARLGCARVQCVNKQWFITCNYDPPGNYVGEKPY